MANLGIEVIDLDYRPLSQFQKTERNPVIAQQSYQAFVSRRNRLIQSVKDELERLTGSTDDQSAKKSSDVAYDRHITKVNEHQLSEKEATNKAVLRRIAINQLRQANKYQSGLAQCEKVDHLGQAHQDQRTQMLTTAAVSANSRMFERKGPASSSDCLFGQRDQSERRPVDHDKNYRERRENRRKELEKQAEQTNADVEEARRRQGEQAKIVTDHRMKRTEKNEQVLAMIQDKNAARDRALHERGAARDEHMKGIGERNEKLEKSRVDRTLERMDVQTKKSAEVATKTKQTMDQKLQEERELLKRRNEAAEGIFTKKKEKIEKYRRDLANRDIEVQSRLTGKEAERASWLAQERVTLEEKTAAVNRGRRSRLCASEMALQKKVSRDLSSVDAARKERVKSEIAKKTAEETFTEKRGALWSIGSSFSTMNERQKIHAVMSALGITEEEAKEIVDVAAQRPSEH